MLCDMDGRIKRLINLYDFLKWKYWSGVALIINGDNCRVVKAVNSVYWYRNCSLGTDKPHMRDLRLSRSWLWTLLSSRMWHPVAWWIVSTISEETTYLRTRNFFTLLLTNIGSLRDLSCLCFPLPYISFTRLIFLPWRWRQNILSKRFSRCIRRPHIKSDSNLQIFHTLL
jgi:hypothetical protein